jgi:hypothetical protein
MLLAILSLLAGLWLGLIRLPWSLPPLGPLGALAHGPLMVAGFLGTLIGIERAIALRRAWMYLGPVSTGLGAILLAAGQTQGGAVLVTLGSAALVAIFAVALRMHRALHTATIAVGAVAWLVGNLLWLVGGTIPSAVLWWMGFLVLTIGGERLELNRVLRLSPLNRGLFVSSIALLIAGMIAASLYPAVGVPVAGAGLIALGLWLLRTDVARHTIRRAGLGRFIAVCLLAGYAWLLIGGALLIAFGPQTAGLRYDAMLHAVFVGFVMSMIFGHAPLMLPAVVGGEQVYYPRFYAHLALLHTSLIARVAGDLLAVMALRRWGGLINVIAVLIFMANTASAVLRRR